MRRGDATQPVSEVNIPALGSVVWLSDTAAAEDLVFFPGAWTGWLRWSVVPVPQSVVVQIGATHFGSEFVSSGAAAVLGGGIWDAGFVTAPAPVQVPAGWRLAIRIVNVGAAACALRTGGGLSAVSSPGVNDPLWPDPVTAVPDAAVAAEPVLGPNRPNPFNPRTEIAFDLPVASRASLRVYDVAGRLVRTLLDAELPAGPGTATWDGRDDAGQAVPTGAYLCRLATAGGGAPLTRRMLLVR
jgi:hypothetical protein